ncbi:GNAT family N-acetyltransferase [Bdellovibrio bacteriovorus]|uniref:GNAT family N-acetyltransferase n=1 Tax=Bdellovibrio bacteriovorus TaxID=959 RepID=UPI0035A6EA4D
MFFKDLGDGFSVREVSAAELRACLAQNFDSVFSNRLEVESVAAENVSKMEKLAGRRKADQRFTLRMGVFHQDQMVGWHFGHATDAETYYMQNSAVLPEYRGKGLYGELLHCVLEKVKMEEFQVVTSIHHPNNPAVLIPKLKAGFIIAGMHFHERFRSLVELRYIYDQERRKRFHRSLGLEF